MALENTLLIEYQTSNKEEVYNFLNKMLTKTVDFLPKGNNWKNILDETLYKNGLTDVVSTLSILEDNRYIQKYDDMGDGIYITCNDGSQYDIYYTDLDVKDFINLHI